MTYTMVTNPESRWLGDVFVQRWQTKYEVGLEVRPGVVLPFGLSETAWVYECSHVDVGGGLEEERCGSPAVVVDLGEDVGWCGEHIGRSVFAWTAVVG